MPQTSKLQKKLPVLRPTVCEFPKAKSPNFEYPNWKPFADCLRSKASVCHFLPEHVQLTDSKKKGTGSTRKLVPHCLINITHTHFACALYQFFNVPPFCQPDF